MLATPNCTNVSTTILRLPLRSFWRADGDFLVNIFTPEQRRKYDLEKLWRKGEVLDVSDCLAGPEELPTEEHLSPSLDDWLDE